MKPAAPVTATTPPLRTGPIADLPFGSDATLSRSARRGKASQASRIAREFAYRVRQRQEREVAMAAAETYDAVIVGAGFSGLYMLHRLRGQGLTARVYEAGPSVGGTWFWNRYPGARVDIESQEYCYSFSPELDAEWQWSERYAAQPELLAYLNHVADRFDLRGDIQLETRVTAAVYDEDARRWTVSTDRGETVSARFVIMATGCLSVPKEGELPGAETFEWPSWHTGKWPREGVDFTGKT